MNPGAQIRIGIVGDRDPQSATHAATEAGLAHAAAAAGLSIEARWVPTESVGEHSYETLGGFHGIWIAPGSPYRNLAGALSAIRFAREGGVPLLGTCGGFQHIVLEYARDVLGFADAAHAEYDPYASLLFINRLACSLVGQSMQVTLDAASQAARWYGATRAQEQYYCNFGLNPEYRETLHRGGLRVVGTDETREARVVELPGHPFFVGTLFVPQARSALERPHPLVVALLRAAQERAPKGVS